MSPLIEQPSIPDSLGEAASLSEDKLSLLADTLGISLEELLRTLPYLLAPLGIDLDPDDTPINLTDQEARITPTCAGGETIEDVTDLQKPLGEGEIEDTDSPVGPQTPAEVAEYESYLKMSCYQIKALYDGKVELLKNGQAGNPGAIERSLDLLEIAAKKNGCHL